MDVLDLLPRGVLQGSVELLLMDRATQPESKELLAEVLRIIKEQPATDAVPREHAHWNGQYCSRCGVSKPELFNYRERANRFCHSCGRRMD